MPTNLVVLSICVGVAFIFLVVGHFTMSLRIRESFDREPEYAIPWGMYSPRDKVGFTLVSLGGVIAVAALPAFIACSVICSR